MNEFKEQANNKKPKQFLGYAKFDSRFCMARPNECGALKYSLDYRMYCTYFFANNRHVQLLGEINFSKSSFNMLRWQGCVDL
jgi:hypothetical protein